MMQGGVSPNVCRSVCLPFTFSLGSSSVGVGSHRSWLWVAIAHTYTLAIEVELLFLHNLFGQPILHRLFESDGPWVCIQDKLSM